MVSMYNAVTKPLQVAQPPFISVVLLINIEFFTNGVECQDYEDPYDIDHPKWKSVAFKIWRFGDPIF